MDAKAIVTRLASEVETLPDVCGVLFFGSAQRGEATTHSDIDLYVLTTGDQAWHEGRVVAGAPVELSFSPLRCMRDRVRQRNPVVTHAFAFGTILLDRGGEVAALSTEARSVWSEGPTALSEAECLSWRFQLTDLLHDVLDLCHDTLAGKARRSETCSNGDRCIYSGSPMLAYSSQGSHAGHSRRTANPGAARGELLRKQ